MNALDLITLQNLKDWLNTAGAQGSPPVQPPYPSTSDPLLARLVTAVSLFATSYLQRNLQPNAYSETYNGQNTQRLYLRQRPVISVSALTIGVATIPARMQPGGYGFVADDASVYVDGACGYPFYTGIQNIAVSYRAGLQNADTVTVPSASPYTLNVAGLSRAWNSDQGVTYATSGVAFTKVTAAPAVAGTYQVKPDTSGTAEYVFNAADTGLGVTISYGYTPDDIVQALVELAGERFRVRGRVGETAQTQGGGLTAAFSQKDMNDTIKRMLNPWRNVVPVQ